MRMVWFGGVLMFFGGILAASDRRYRLERSALKAPVTSAQTAAT